MVRWEALCEKSYCREDSVEDQLFVAENDMPSSSLPRLYNYAAGICLFLG